MGTLLLCFRCSVSTDVGLHVARPRHHVSQLHTPLHPQVSPEEVLTSKLLQTHVVRGS